VPSSDGGLFDLSIDGMSYDNGGAGYGNGGDTGFYNVSVGSHSVSEAAHSGTSLADYDSSISCDDDALTSGSGASLGGINVSYGDQVTCTITNEPLYTMIVLVCRQSDDSLYASNVALDGVTNASLGSSEIESQLCALGGARFEGLSASDTEDYYPTVDIGTSSVE
jgi:hypothetical protein